MSPARWKSATAFPSSKDPFTESSDSSDSLREIARLLIERGAPDELMGADRSGHRARRSEGLGRDRALSSRGFKGKKVLLITGGVKSWSVVAALQEAGLELVGTSVKKSTKEDKERIKELMGQDAHMIDDMTPREMYKMLKDARADIMLSGGRSQFVALKASMPWLDINQERHHAYMGYVGMVKLVEEIDKALFNPIWEQVRKPAPWENPANNWQAKAIAQLEAEAACACGQSGACRKNPAGQEDLQLQEALTSVRLKMPFWLMRWQRSKVSKKKPTPRAVAEPVPSGLRRSWPTCRYLKTRALSPSSPPRSRKWQRSPLAKRLVLLIR